jgi:ATP-binding cassette subfamily B (MDR/TAP) protein 1
MFACSGEALTKRLRSQAFRAILRQDITYFDQANHNTGALCTYLATEASAVKGASGIRVGLMLQNVVTIGGGIVIGFIFSWQLTLLIIAFLPLIVFGAFIQIRLIARFSKKDQERLADAGQVFIGNVLHGFFLKIYYIF